ncbi:MAG: glycosyltransferase family 2 protein [Bacteroidales bacterium]|nr:glycosyltransferase family 2 protein [Bacteroidales bacterium]
MNLFYSIINIVQLIFLVYFTGSIAYLLIFAVAGCFKRDDIQYITLQKRNIAIIIPAFKEDAVIIEVIESALKQNYPASSYQIILIADSFKQETLNVIRSLPITLVEVAFDFSTKAKSLQVALNYLPDNTDLVLILDADNIMEENFLNKINSAAESSYKIIQCHRIAKNTNTSFAVLDAISEEINNNIFRSGHTALGVSSALIGSAMVFNIEMFRKYIPKLNAIGGFDKELELMILRDKVKIQYLKNAYVFDEKVQNANVFYKQRKRWIYSQFYFFGRDFLLSIYHLFTHRNFDYFDKTLQFSLPPRLILLGTVGFVNILNLFFINQPYQYCWLGLLILICLTLLISIPRKFFCVKTLRALINLPKIFFLMILILLKIRGSNKGFIHTEHDFYNTSSKTYKS